MSRQVFIFLILLITSPFAFSNSAIVTMAKGTSEIFVNPASEPVGKGPHVKFNGLFYKIKKLKIGRKIKYKQIVKTGVAAQVKLTYPNGDTFMVGPATAYSLVKTKTKGTKKSFKILNLLYGKVRAVISKKGPLNKLKVVTKTSVAGVRGTDFFLSYFPAKEQTSLSVLRGQVNLKHKASNKKPVKVKTGTTAQIIAIPAEGDTGKPIHKEIHLKPVTKDKLIEIQNTSHIQHTEEKAKAIKIEIARLDQSIMKEIHRRNNKSVDVVLEDIKIENRTHYDVLIKAHVTNKIKNIEFINTQVVGKLFEKAPMEKENKLSESDLNSSGDFYEKYNKSY